MSIVDWFVNDLESEERILTKDLVSVAVADKEFAGDEMKTILDICKKENISDEDFINSIRGRETDIRPPQTLEEKKKYLLYLIKVMSVDKAYPMLELHIIEIIAKKLGISSIQLISFILDEIKDNNVSQEEGIVIIDKFVRHLIITGA